MFNPKSSVLKFRQTIDLSRFEALLGAFGSLNRAFTNITTLLRKVNPFFGSFFLRCFELLPNKGLGSLICFLSFPALFNLIPYLSIYD